MEKRRVIGGEIFIGGDGACNSRIKKKSGDMFTWGHTRFFGNQHRYGDVEHRQESERKAAPLCIKGVLLHLIN
jgi:hypothetical protein